MHIELKVNAKIIKKSLLILNIKAKLNQFFNN